MRCFIAIELPREIQERLAELQDELRLQVHGATWARSEQIHLTVKFLGDVRDADVTRAIESAAAVIGRYAPFDLTVAGAGCFPPHGPARVLWVGMPSPPMELLTCQKELEQAMAGFGIPPENRPYHPHLTLGRVKDFHAGREARAAMEAVAAFDAGGFAATEMVMFQSMLQRSGPIYTVIGRMPLNGPAVR
jgi:2'-5' RNA ligase